MLHPSEQERKKQTRPRTSYREEQLQNEFFDVRSFRERAQPTTNILRRNDHLFSGAIGGREGDVCGATRYLLAAVLSGTIRDYTGGCGMKCNNCGGLSVLLGLLGGNTCSRFCANRRVTSGGAVLGQASGVGAHLFYRVLVGKV